MDELGIFFVGFFVVILFFIFIGLIFHVFMAIGLYKIAKREGFEDKAWLAWIPIVNQFLITLLVEKDVEEHFKGNLTLTYGVSLIASMFLAGFIPFVAFVPAGLLLYAFYYIAKRYSTNEVAHIVIAALTGSGSLCIQLFMFRNRERLDIQDGIEIIDKED